MEQEIDKRSADTILADIHSRVENKIPISREKWLDAAFYLNSFFTTESQILNGMRQEIAQKKLEILRAQEKRSVAMAEIEVEASDVFRLMKDQEAKLDAISEYIRIAKKSAEENYQ